MGRKKIISALEYFNNEDLPTSIWTDKYALRNEEDDLVEKNPDQMFRGIAKELARVEKAKFKEPYTEEFIYEVIEGFGAIIPQGSPLYGIRNPKPVSLSNCYVVKTADSYGAICNTDEQLAQLCKRRAGVGVDISPIRPANMPVNNSSRKAAGILPFMERFSNTIREVGQDGRRGALMITISVHHPQILDFITAKLDGTKVTGANISVRCTDEFMKAVEEDTEYELRWPVEGKAVYSKKVKAKYIWDRLIESSWLKAEPGILFWSNIIRESPADCYKEEGFETISTNPCSNASNVVISDKGLKQFGELQEGDIIWTGKNWTKVINKICNGKKNVYRYITTAGYLDLTEEHEIYSGGKKVQVKDADTLDINVGPIPNVSDIVLNSQDIVDGWVLGDGQNHNGYVVLHIGEKDKEFYSNFMEYKLETRTALDKNHDIITVKTTILPDELPRVWERKIPDRFKFGNINKVISFLKGIYSANGSVCGERITLKSTSISLIRDVQQLLSSIGIRSYYTTNKPSKVKWDNGEFTSKQSYDLNITSDRNIFATLIGVVQKYKTDNINKILTTKPSCKLSKSSYTIISKEFLREEDVYDITVEDITHAFWCNGFKISNCGEIPLCELDSCRLLVVNLFYCVDNPFTDKAIFNFDKLKKYAYIAQRIMDDIVDLEIEKITQIIEKIKSDKEPDNIKATELLLWEKVLDKCIRGRRTGTGITALGDAIAAVGIKYGTEESIDLTNEIYKTLKLSAYRCSVDMAKELGAFPIWDKEREKDNPFFYRIKMEDPELWEDMQLYGRRNMACLTTAPVGSISQLVGPYPYFGSTSGIECLFKDEPYTRRKKINHGDTTSIPDYVDAKGDKWQHFTVYHSKLKMWMDITGETDYKKSPYHKACANDINWENRVKLQAVANRHIDHSISSTINLPEDVTIEEVKKIYETAWKSGCKGLTIYRDKCRDGVLIDKPTLTDTITDRITQTTAAIRPKTGLECDIHRIKVNGYGGIILIGKLHGEPYEMFSSISDGMNNAIVDKCPLGEDKGIITKEKRGVYNLILNDGTKITNIHRCLTEDQASIARLVSTALRHGVPLQFIVHQLEKVKTGLSGYVHSVSRVLKKYIKDGVKISGEDCPNCKQPTLQRKEGCKICSQCTYSGCS